MDLSEKIRALRLEQGKTLDQVAKSVGVSKSTVSKWESGYIANMRRDKVAKLAHELDTTPEYLLGWNDDAPFFSPSVDWDGPQLKAIREERGESAEYAAMSIGVPLSHYHGFEAGTSAPSISELKKIVIHFSHSADELLGLEWPCAPAPGLTKGEVELLSLFRDLNAEGRERLLETADDMVSSGKYKKSASLPMGREA